MNKIDYLAEIDENMLLADGFEDALIGIAERYGQPPVALYDRDKCLEILLERDGTSSEEAWEFFDYNVLGSYVGEYTPIFAVFIRGDENDLS
jgi:hypothetical protein